MRNFLRKFLIGTVLASILLSVPGTPVLAYARIKDIAKVQGVRSNQLVGYGLIVGLAGTGDSNKSDFTLQSIANVLKSFGVMIDSSQFQTKNAAAVMVTAQLPAFAKPGDTIDITVSSMGDAKSLQGGTLLQTPLRAANGAVYAVGQGSLATGGYVAGSNGSSQQKNFTTAGNIPNGAIVEKDVPTQFGSRDRITLSLSQPDFTTASRISEAIDSRFGQITEAKDPGTVIVNVPYNYSADMVGFIAAVEELPVTPDNSAKVVINEKTGTVVIGNNVTIDEVAVAQGGLTVRISRQTDVSQPPPFSNGNTVVTTQTNVNVQEQPAGLIVLPAASSVSSVVRALNAVGATPRDVIAILQAIKAAGALHADLQIM
ncbi:MAG TPA: flagellar basal body P-ring protein FlgI [Methylomusa anaerophila]|uniref:Flagellar P-ring protein n=1 Tax=Methylomusa anaerophila TaxID=1930071 RepID=A0A348AKE3_9FIRM|nr:flagellar basal body P-ring protein FlgI [Methylomusa anaerophila]BBB91541.1 flagellar P-ring protein precursor [Methylomusa anaerophila]HML89521.1 flagellar basal body P-ring protein FlgI [Methylomusa anaerophila]